MHHHNDTRPKTSIIVNEDGADLSRDIVTREPLPVAVAAWEQFRRAVESGSVRDEVAALHDLHAAIFGRAA